MNDEFISYPKEYLNGIFDIFMSAESIYYLNSAFISTLERMLIQDVQLTLCTFFVA